MAYEFGDRHDLVVIGGGPGGYEAALTGAQLGANVTLIERNGVGGSAVLTDVVPSKALIAVAEAATQAANAQRLGVEILAPGTDEVITPDYRIDLGTVNRRLLELARQQSLDMAATLEKQGVRIVEGTGRLLNHHAVAADLGNGEVAEFHADTTVVSVGAHPRKLPSAMPDGERILTWTQLYHLEQLPEHLIVVGSGVTGAEFASAFRPLGSEVTLISSRDRVLPGQDEDAARVIEEVFLREGMHVLSKSRAESVVREGDEVVVTLSDGTTVVGSHCLMAVGSIPNTAGLGLEGARVQTTANGHIKVNRVARTSVPEIYAAGDCTDFFPLASVANMQGRTAVYHALGDAAQPIKLRNVASNIFTSPEIASVGWTQSQIEEGLAQGVIYKYPLEENPRAKMQNITDGFVKLFARTQSGTVIGGVVVAPKASELIFPLALAVEQRLTVDQVANAFAVYPSLTGAITDAARALHMLKG
jgi:NAD(P)H dehydrogenase (quinone)